MDSESLKKQYLDCEVTHTNTLNQIVSKLKLCNIKKEMNTIDNLLDVYNYTNFAFNVNKMLYLSAYIGLYMNENNIVNSNKIPVKTALKILMKMDWITQKTKDFLNKYFIRSLNGEDFTKYAISLDSYLKSNLF